MLFPEDIAHAAVLPIKGKFAVRARFTGNVGIYHLQGCPQLCRPDPARPLVLLRGRCAGRGLPPRLNCRPAESPRASDATTVPN